LENHFWSTQHLHTLLDCQHQIIDVNKTAERTDRGVVGESAVRKTWTAINIDSTTVTAYSHVSTRPSISTCQQNALGAVLAVKMQFEKLDEPSSTTTAPPYESTQIVSTGTLMSTPQ
jgi:hypothetical protein